MYSSTSDFRLIGRQNSGCRVLMSKAPGNTFTDTLFPKGAPRRIRLDHFESFPAADRFLLRASCFFFGASSKRASTWAAAASCI